MAQGNMNNRPTVSVCIANYNGMDIIDACIESVLAQDCSFPVEIIVHDDASTDGSAQHIREHYPDVKLLESIENAGFCLANNRMVESASGEYVLLLNNDAALAPDALTTLYECALQQAPQGVLTLPQYDWETNKLVDRGCLLDPFYNPVPNHDSLRSHIAMVIGACLWIPRTLWHQLGGFPEWFESVAEDMYLCCRARLAGYPVQVTRHSHYRHHQGASFGGNRASGNRLVTTYRRRRLSERNKTFVMVLCSPPLRLWLTLPLHLALLALEGVLLVIIRRDGKLWREIYGNVFTSLAEKASVLRQERKYIQATRSLSGRAYSRCFLWMPRKLQLLMRHGLPSLR
jgi:GT2 family glycosyltransferase